MIASQPSSASVRASENNGPSAPSRISQIMADRDGNRPVWVRAPKRGQEYYSGCSRPKLYEWAAKGFIRSASIREPGRLKGIRLFHLASILAFIESCEIETQSDQHEAGKGT